MINNMKTYISDMGVITSIGVNARTTFAAVNAGISGYKISDYSNIDGYPITMASVPDEVFQITNIEEDTASYYCKQFDRIIKIAVISLREALSKYIANCPVPLVLTMPEEKDARNYISKSLLVKNLIKQKDLPLDKNNIYFVPKGRAGGIQGFEIVQHLLNDKGFNYVLTGGSDSYESISRLYDLDENERLLAENRYDGFAPGEGAGFILLTNNKEKALNRNNNIISVLPPGTSMEEGHLYSLLTYKGNGLDTAFKLALIGCKQGSVSTVYSSMNGENHWAKEYGVACMRNKNHLADNYKIMHPADCYGDLGVATGSVLVAMSALSLFKNTEQAAQLVYSSSDTEWRSAIRLEKTDYLGVN